MHHLLLPHSKYSDDFRVKATYGVAVIAVIALTPFACISFYLDRVVIGVVMTLVILLLATVAWTIRRGNYTTRIVFLGLVPCTLLLLTIAIQRIEIIGALWCYPTIVAYYFTMAEKRALVSNLLLLAIQIPNGWLVLEPEVSLRFAATLIAVSALSYVFLRMVLSQQEKIMRNEKLRRESMASVSHELRTPLATAITRVDAMLDEIRPTDKEQLNSLSRSLIHLNKIVDDLYALALADVDALVIDKELTRLDEIVNEALDAAQEKFTEKDFHLSTAIVTGINIYGDPKYLRQVIDNLLENCYRYTSPTANVLVHLSEENGWADLVISDSGPGIDEQTRKALFERFHRADPSRSRETGGTGLGLALVKAMTEAHGGQVEAFHSDEGGLGIRIKLRTS